ncbi:MAG: hypothetical protein AABX16_00005 [Nanoarchaeota archaeon]
MKRVLAFVILILSVYLFSLEVVSAQYPAIDGFVRQVGEASASIFGPIFGHNIGDEFLFAKILLFILLFTITFMALKHVSFLEDKKSILTVVAAIVGILSVRYLEPNALITAILLPYGALGGAITIFLPLLVYFYFIHTTVESPVVRRFAWFVYAAILIFFWFNQFGSLGSANWIYILSFVFIGINFLFDKTLHSYFGLTALEHWRTRAEDARIASLQGQYDQIRDVQSKHADRRRREIMRDLRRQQADRW